MYHVRYKEGGGLYTGIFDFFFFPQNFPGGFVFHFISLEPGASSDGWVEATPVTDERRLALGPMKPSGGPRVDDHFQRIWECP